MKEIRLYKTGSGKEPFEDWLTRTKDKTTEARIRRRVDHLSFGHEGDCKSVGSWVYELRLMFGSGYRIYYGKSGNIVIVLLGRVYNSSPPPTCRGLSCPFGKHA